MKIAKDGAPSFVIVKTVKGWATRPLSYDANGNMLSDGLHNYAWDARNHLSTIDAGSTASFVYDPGGRRATKVISGAQTNFLYDLANPVQELSGTTPTANLLTGGLDEYFTRTDAAGTAIFLTDALGSTTALADSTGTVQTQYTFDPFGNTAQSGTMGTNSFAYTGRENDGTGLYYFRARYYNSTLGRFVSEDPIGFAGGLNFYAYVGDNPINRSDPLGLFWPSEHYEITFFAGLQIGMSPEDAANLADSVAAVDSRTGTQESDAYDANTHAMAGRKPNGKFQTCEQARAGTENQIGNALANNDIGKALHTIQDSYSPSHINFQQWDGGYNLWGISGLWGSASWQHVPSLAHMWGDYQSSIHNPAVQDAIAATELALQYPGLNPGSFLPGHTCGE